MSNCRSGSNHLPWPFSSSRDHSRVSDRFFRAFALAAALLVLQVLPAQAGPVRGKCPAGMVDIGTKCGTPVITEIISFDSGGYPYTIQSDGQGTYSHGNGVSSYLLEDGNNGKKHDWFLDVRGSANRRIAEYVLAADRVTAAEYGGDYYAPNEASNLPAPGASQGQMNVQCTFVSNDLMQIQPGSPVTCPFMNAFLYNGDDHWNLSASKSFWQQPQNITDVQITCLSYNSFDARGCDEWKITPITDPSLAADSRLLDPVTGQMQTVGHLEHAIAVSRNKTTKEVDGNFKMRFYIHLVRPTPVQ